MNTHHHSTVPSDPELRVKALESLLVEKGLVDPKTLDELVDLYETKIGPRNGAKVVAKAWKNPEFKKYAGKFYSPFSIKRIISKIDQIIDQNELQFVQHSVTETPDQDGIDIVFNIFEGRKIQIERVNIKGNSITNDSVIRSELEVDEGDPYSAVKV